jgi:hypothetical protein
MCRVTVLEQQTCVEVLAFERGEGNSSAAAGMACTRGGSAACASSVMMVDGFLLLQNRSLPPNLNRNPL